jgi:selenocysteine lyase/cysteine desulfurase
MLTSQRSLFDIPRNVCYLNAAAWSPLPLAVQEAGRRGVARKGRPWTIEEAFPSHQYERARNAAARLVNADTNDLALISSVAYGVATAAKGLTVAPGSRVLVLQEDHASPVLEWMARSATGGFVVETVERLGDGDWTAAILAAIGRPGAAPVTIASISWVHWCDGGVVDLGKVAAALRAQGAALLIDATHGAGVLSMDVKALDPDFVVFPTYKWLLGPYGRAFLYVAKRHQDKTPLEQTAFGRRAVRAEQATYLADTRYLPDARRFDMGERDHFVSLEMASIGMEMAAGWGSAAIVERLSMLTARLVDGLSGLNVSMAPVRVRAPHVLCLGFPGCMPDGLVRELAAENIHIAARLGRARISPHVYNDEADIDRFVAAMWRALSP